MALDLGGTNFRVLLVQVGAREQGGVRIVSEVYSIPPQVAQGLGSQVLRAHGSWGTGASWGASFPLRGGWKCCPCCWVGWGCLG